RSAAASRALAILVVLVVLVVLSKLSRAQETREIKLPKLGGAVDVIFDEFAIPHIYGKTPEDVYRALGYLHATDRLLEMEFMRRTAEGTLSEVAGEDTYEADLLMRKLGIRETSEETLK